MFYGNLTGFGGGFAGGFAPLGVNFDGTNDYINRGAGWVGESDKAANWTFVFWAKMGNDGTAMHLQQGAAGCFDFNRPADNLMKYYTYGGGCYGFRNICFSNNTLVIADGWTCVMMSCDTSTNQMYFGDSDVTASQQVSASAESHTFNSTIGAASGGGAKWNGDLAEIFIDLDNRLDLSVVGNRRKFFSAAGKPVDLGDSGELPTGASPCLYLSVRPGQSASDFVTNRGTGGNYTEVGALSLSSTNPAG